MPRLRHNPDHPLADEKGWVELNDDYYRYLPDANSPKDGSANVISDHMPETRHMADGKYYDSKSKFRQVTKAHGCIEVGNDSSIVNPKPRAPIQLDRRQRREDIQRSIYELKNGRRS